MGRVGLSGYKYHPPSETRERNLRCMLGERVCYDRWPLGFSQCGLSVSGSVASIATILIMSVVMMGKVGSIIVSFVSAISSCFKHYPPAWRVTTVVSSSCRAIREGCVCSAGRSSRLGGGPSAP